MKRSKTALLLALVSLLGLACGSLAAPAFADESRLGSMMEHAGAQHHVGRAGFAPHVAGDLALRLASPLQLPENDRPLGNAGWGGQGVVAETSTFDDAGDVGLMLYVAGGALLVLGSGGVTQAVLRRPQV